MNAFVGQKVTEQLRQIFSSAMERFHQTDPTKLSDNVLESEFPFLKDECYLDHAGCALYCRSQIDEIAKDFSSNLYSNPHSSGTTSKHCTDTIDQVRFRILSHFNTDTDEYSVVFTSGATAALKLVAETFNFSLKDGCSGTFAYLQESHTSVLGMREIVVHRGGKLRCVRHDEAFDLFGKQTEYESSHGFGDNSLKENSLFVFPAQCNFSGLKYPLKWIDGCHRGMLNAEYTKSSSRKWYCMLDAASLVSTSPLDLSKHKPDFVCLSFYKIFGFPTGLGALLVANSAIDVLDKTYYGGGTVLIALSSQPFHVKKPLFHERYEDGTLNFLSIVSLLHGLEAMRRLGGDMHAVSLYCYGVAYYCYDKLLRLHHANSKPAIIVYCDSDFSDAGLQGNIVNFNVLRHNGDYVGYSEVLALANLRKIHLRTGCFCNPGACQRHLNLNDDQLKHHFQKGHVCGDSVDLINGQPTGSIRVSFGIYSQPRDVDKLISLIEDCFILKPVMYKMPDSWLANSQKLMKKFNDNRDTELDVFNGDHKKDGSNKNNFAGPNIFTHRLSSINIQEYHKASVDDRRGNIKLERIFIYPIKSCAAMEVCNSSWPIDSRGFKYDRQWMVISAKGVALTQKIEPLLCLINPHLSLDSGSITLSARGKPNFSLPIESDAVNVSESLGIKLCQSKVCGDRVSVVDCGDDVAAWLSDLLNRSGVRLVRQCVDDSRIKRNILNSRSKVEAKSMLSNGKQDVSPKLSLSNQAQFLLISSSTVKWLADQIPADSDCNKDNLVYRFRSNFVVNGSSLEPFAEMNWTKIAISGNLFKVVGPCGRCQMICIDQFTGELTKEPLTTLAASLHGKLKFGVYLEHIVNDDRFDESIVKSGDVVQCYESC